MDAFERLDWFLTHRPIQTQFSICHSLNTYDDVIRQQIQVLKDVLPEKYAFEGHTVSINPFFSGVKSVDLYMKEYKRMYTYYGDATTLEVQDPKKNPHYRSSKKH